MIRGLLALALAASLPALAVGDASFPDRIAVADATLEVRGGGTLRWRGLVAIYDAALWTGAGQTVADPLDAQVRRIEFRYRRTFSAADLAAATTATLGRDLPADQRAALKPGLDRLNALYRDVVEGNRLAFTCLPDAGVQVERDGQLIDTIPDPAFARALFAIWIGPDPVHAGFRAALRGER